MLTIEKKNGLHLKQKKKKIEKKMDCDREKCMENRESLAIEIC